MPRAGTASPIDAPTESLAMRLAGRKLTRSPQRRLAHSELGDRDGWEPCLHRCASRRRSRAGEPQARGVVVLTLPRRKPNAVLEDDQVAGEVARWSHWLRARKESLLDVKHCRDGANITSNGN